MTAEELAEWQAYFELEAKVDELITVGKLTPEAAQVAVYETDADLETVED